MDKKILLSGIQPSGDLHIGSYLGSIKNWVKMYQDFQSFFCIVDLHAITVPQNPDLLRKRSLEIAKLYIACGIDPEKALIFVQSHVPQHTQLAWVLNCFTYLGELGRMTQYKEKSEKQKSKSSGGLLIYPVLQAADILLYQTNLVPVGEDQRQHLELTRNIALRFNNRFQEQVFTIPEIFIPEKGARVKDLQKPLKKMSKSSENQNGTIFLLDDEEIIRKKISRAVTDNLGKVKYDPENQPGISNLLNIYAGFVDKDISEVELLFKNSKYKDLKQKIADIIIEELKPIQEKYYSLKDDDIKEILYKNADIAKKLAQTTLDKVYEVIGFLQ